VFAQPFDLTSAAGQDDIVADLFLKFRVEAGDELHGRFHDPGKDAFAGAAHFLGDIVHRGLSVDGDFHHDRFCGFAHEAVLFLEAADHIQCEIRIGITFMQGCLQLLVNIITGGPYGLWSSSAGMLPCMMQKSMVPAPMSMIMALFKALSP
jgi:hypothetical protein